MEPDGIHFPDILIDLEFKEQTSPVQSKKKKKKSLRALTTFPMFSESATLADDSGTSPNKQNLYGGSESGQQMGAGFCLR